MSNVIDKMSLLIKTRPVFQLSASGATGGNMRNLGLVNFIVTKSKVIIEIDEKCAC